MDDKVMDHHTSANEISTAKVATTIKHTEDVIATHREEGNTNPQEIPRNTGTTSTTTADPTTTTCGIKVDQMKLETSTTEGHLIDSHGGREDHQLKGHNPADQHLNDMLPRKQITV
jgi:hypothetical protein